MKNVFFLVITGMLFASCNLTEPVFIESKDAYYGQKPPGLIAEIFAPEIIKHLAHSSPSFTPDGREIYWSTISGENETRKIYYVKFDNDKWSEPILADFSGNYHDDQPFITFDGEKLYFASKRPKVKDGNQENECAKRCMKDQA